MAEAGVSSHQLPQGRRAAGRRLDRGSCLSGRELVRGVQDAASVLGLLREWDQRASDARGRRTRRRSQRRHGAGSDVTLLAPILYPGALYCAGANYWDHLEEMAEIAKRVTGKAPSMTKATDPYFFMKNCAGAIIGDGTPARLPSFSQQVDWEAELGVVIGKTMPQRVRSRRLQRGRRLSDRQRSVRARSDEARRLALRHGLGRAEMLRGRARRWGPWFTPAAYVGDPE